MKKKSSDGNSNTTDNTTEVTSNKKHLPIGIILSIQPSINFKNRNVTLNIRPTLSRITEEITDPGVAILAKRLGCE